MSMKRKSKWLAVPLSALALCACQQPKFEPAITTDSQVINGVKTTVTTEIDKLGNQTTTTVSEKQLDTRQFASINLPNKTSMTEYHAPNGLNNLVDIPRFIGDIEDLTYLITAHTGYKYIPYSGIKVSPVIVTYEAHNKTALEALTEINNLVGNNVTIKVSEVAQSVQVIYPISALTFE